MKKKRLLSMLPAIMLTLSLFRGISVSAASETITPVTENETVGDNETLTITDSFGFGDYSGSQGISMTGAGSGPGTDGGADKDGNVDTFSETCTDVIKENSISDQNYKTNTATSGIIFEGDNGTVYENVTLTENMEIESGKTLTVPTGITLTIPDDVTLTNNGTLIVMGDLKGSVSKNQPINKCFRDISISFGQDISFNYFANLSEYKVETAIVRFTMNGKSVEVSGEPLDDGLYKFGFCGATPQCMCDTITAELFINGELIDTKQYSELEYLNKLKCMTKDELGYSQDKYDKMITFINDLLIYGGAAQKYVGHNTGSLVSDGITGSEFNKIERSDLALVQNGTYVTFIKANLYFDNVNRLRFKFQTDDTSGLTFKCTKKDGSEYDIGYTSNGNGNYMVETDKITATKFDDLYTITAYKNGIAGASITYSVRSYIYAMQEGDTAMAELAKATYNYGNSAKAFKNAT